MKSLAGVLVAASMALSGGEARADDGSKAHSANQLYFGFEGSGHHGALQTKYMRSLGGGLELGGAVSAGVNTHKHPVFGLEAVLACGRDVTKGVGVVLELAAGMEAVKDSVHGVAWEPVVKAALNGEVQVGEHSKLYAGPYVAKVGHDVQVGGTAGVAVGF